MQKILKVLLLVASLLAQDLAFAKGLAGLEAAIHAAPHASAPHHHGDDGSTHYDSSDQSLQHMCADHCCFTSGPAVRAPAVASPLLRNSRPAEARESPPPDPFLEGPRRPPRFVA